MVNDDSLFGHVHVMRKASEYAAYLMTARDRY